MKERKKEKRRKEQKNEGRKKKHIHAVLIQKKIQNVFKH